MDVAQLNRIAQQVANAIQECEGVQSIRFLIWQRGITDPDAYVATGRITCKGQRPRSFELGFPHIRELLT